MKKLNRSTANISKPYPERILQFGGGNFLRGFVDWMVDVFNESTNSELGILVVKPTERGDYDEWRQQEGLFHILTKGIKNGKLLDEKHLVKCVSRIIHPYKNWEAFISSAENPDLRYIISNTTETGIRTSSDDQFTDAPPHEFPAKLTLWMHHRYEHFQGDKAAGCVIIPTELLEQNGELLRDCILQNAENWQLDNGFTKWVREANTFCNTLVDRIIPGVGKDAEQQAWQQAGFQDEMITQGEPYHLWAIEVPEKGNSLKAEFPIDKVGLNVIYTNDLSPFRTSKVRILNGAHTTMVPVGYLYGIETVQETVEHEVMGQYVRQAIFDEILPTLDLPGMDVQQFANDVLDRFKNPFIKHRLISISLNSISKFKVRVLPSILEYQQRHADLPTALVFSFAALIRFYKGQMNGTTIPLNDESWVVDFFRDVWQHCDGSDAAIAELIKKVLQWEKVWEMDLLRVPGLHDLLTQYLIKIENKGLQETVKSIIA